MLNRTVKEIEIYGIKITIEIDGSRVTLFINGEKICEQRKDFEIFLLKLLSFLKGSYTRGLIYPIVFKLNPKLIQNNAYYMPKEYTYYDQKLSIGQVERNNVKSLRLGTNRDWYFLDKCQVEVIYNLLKQMQNDEMGTFNVDLHNTPYKFYDRISEPGFVYSDPLEKCY